ncbi:hypothetical protein ACEWY4_013463 [Coilia grayii]|uniref:Cytohesin Ubiquitin Protein Inducing domain-containing protein n=1 Tax=Coilia grayii TaxID=363190 RepID=A0ABD1JWH5_9TELE
MEAKEETSDTDSGIILHSGPDSPCTVLKEVSTHTRAVRLKLQALEERLEACVCELKQLCIREAELTGHLSSDYPLRAGERPPQIRRRIGAAFKLDEQSLLDKPEECALSSVEAKLACQQQIVVAVRRLVQEGAPSKAVRRSRQQQCRQEEKKLLQLQEAIFQLRLQHGRESPLPAITGHRDQPVSDDSSLSDSALLDDEERASQASQPSLEAPPPDPTQPRPRPHPHPLQEQCERHAPPHTLGLRPSLGHTYSYLPSPTRSPAFNHSQSPLPSPSPNHTHIRHSPIPSPAFNHSRSPAPSTSPNHTHIIASPLPSPSTNHTHTTSSPSLNHTPVRNSPIPSPAFNHTLSPPSPSLNHAHTSPSPSPADCTEAELPPIRHTPWAESSLDQPYEKKKSRSSTRNTSSPVVTPTLPPLEACVGEGGLASPMSPHAALRATCSNSAPCTPEMTLRRGLSLRLPSSGAGSDADQERGRSRMSRRRLIDVAVSPDYPPLHVSMGNPLYYSSSEDSASEHSAASYTGSPCREQPAIGHPEPRPHVQPHPPNGFYRNTQHQSTPSFPRGGYAPPYPRAPPVEPDYGSHASLPSGGRYDYRYEEALGSSQPGVRMPCVVPAHVRLSRAPSLREYPPHHPARALPRQLLSDQLKAWHQRQHLALPHTRPRSLDRQGAVRIRSSTHHDSPLSQQPLRLDQPPEVGRVPRAMERNCGPWTMEDDTHIISQV